MRWRKPSSYTVGWRQSSSQSKTGKKVDVKEGKELMRTTLKHNLVDMRPRSQLGLGLLGTGKTTRSCGSEFPRGMPAVDIEDNGGPGMTAEQFVNNQWEECLDGFLNIACLKMRASRLDDSDEKNMESPPLSPTSPTSSQAPESPIHSSPTPHRSESDSGARLEKNTFYCFDCATETSECNQFWHSRVLPLKDTLFYPLKEVQQDNGYECQNGLPFLYLPQQHLLNCTGQHNNQRSVTVFDFRGRARKCQLQMCSESMDACTLLWHNVWPATVEDPGTVMDMSLMELLYTMVTETRISLWRACKAIQSCANLHFTPCKAKDLYDQLGRTRSFRYFRRHVQSIHQLRDVGSESVQNLFLPQCAACAKNDVEVHVCVDASFQLVRKNKGTAVDRIDEGTTAFWAAQSEVDKAVDTADISQPDTVCSDFDAGNTLIAKRRNKHCTVTGVIGYNCRHQHPGLYADMKAGEKFGYPKCLLKCFMDKIKTSAPNIKVTAFYDVCCKLVRHLELSKCPVDKELLDFFEFRLPVFHSYAHNLKCQLEYNPRFDGSCGLTDGEGVERLWSVMQEASKCLKEMTASNRQAFLDDILRCYSAYINNTLDQWLLRRYQFAVTQYEYAEIQLNEVINLIEDEPENAMSIQEMCEQWRVVLQMTLGKIEKPNKSTEWKRKLMSLMEEKRQKEEQKDRAHLTVRKEDLKDQIRKLEKDIEAIRTKHEEARNWVYGDAWFLGVQKEVRLEILRPILKALFKASVERAYFISIQKRHNGTKLLFRLT